MHGQLFLLVRNPPPGFTVDNIRHTASRFVLLPGLLVTIENMWSGLHWPVCLPAYGIHLATDSRETLYTQVMIRLFMVHSFKEKFRHLFV